MVAVALRSLHTTHRRSQRGSHLVLLEASPPLVASRSRCFALRDTPPASHKCLPLKTADSGWQVAIDEPRREAEGRGAERAATELAQHRAAAAGLQGRLVSLEADFVPTRPGVQLFRHGLRRRPIPTFFQY